MQSTLLLGCILIPLTCGLRTFQNSMIGRFNANIPVWTGQGFAYSYPHLNRQDYMKKILQEHIKKITEEVALEKSSANTKPPNVNLDFPGLRVHNNAYPPTKLRQPNGDENINIDARSSKALRQYFPVPPSAKERGGKDIFNRGRIEYDVPIEQSREYSSPPIGKAVREENNGGMVGNNGYNERNNGYNGGNNGYNGVNNGFNGENNGYKVKNNDYNQDMAVNGGVIKEMTPAEKWWALTGTTLDQVSEKQDLDEKYLMFTKSFIGNEIEKDALGFDIEELVSLGYKGGSNGYNGGSTGINGASNGFNGGSTGINGGSTGINGGNNGIHGGSTGIKGANNGLNGGSTGINGGSTGINVGSTGINGGNKGINRGSNGINGGSNGFNGGSNGSSGGSSGINGGNNGINGGSNVINGGSNGINGGLKGFTNGAKKALRQGYNIQYTGMKARIMNNKGEKGNNGENFEYYHDLPTYATIIKAIPPKKSTVWTTKPLNLNPKQQDLEQQYKRTLDMLNGMIYRIEN